ncbi:MAG: YybH family protein [Anaerolineae bacterium]|jgi:ketosteroid isomerase-like protein
MAQVSTDVRGAIDAANKRFADAVSRGDAAALGTMYTDDAQVMPPNADIIQGPAAIQAMWKSLMDVGLKGMDIDTLEVDDLGDTAIEVARFALYGPDRQVLDRGKYIVVWKRKGSEWKLHRDIFNSSLPRQQ